MLVYLGAAKFHLGVDAPVTRGRDSFALNPLLYAFQIERGSRRSERNDTAFGVCQR